MTMTPARSLAALAACTLLLAGCSGDADAPASSPADPAPTTGVTTDDVTAMPLPTEPFATATETVGTATPSIGSSDAALLTPRADLTNEQPLAWTPAGSEGKAVFINVTTANPKCQGVRVEKEETKESVRITTYLGTPPGAPEMCTREAFLGKIKVDLDEPLGSRSLLHGANEPSAS